MIYVVQPGDSLFSIAQRFNTSIAILLSLNPQITNPNFIFPAQIITVPSQLCPLLRQGDLGPAVSRFQTLLTIARFDPGPIDGIFGPRTQAALLAFQRTVKVIEVTGMADLETWVLLGAECEPRPGITSYTVRPGDTLFIIATRFYVTIESILRANQKITNPNFLFAGQIINMPSNIGNY